MGNYQGGRRHWTENYTLTQVSVIHLIIRWLKKLGVLILSLDWLIQTSSDQTFQPIALIYTSGKFREETLDWYLILYKHASGTLIESF